MFKRILIVLLALLAVVGLLAFLKFQQIQAQIALFSQPQPPTTVAAAEVQITQWEPTLRAVGSIQAVQGVLVNNQVQGQIERILFESGDQVEAGAPLVQLDTEVDQADLAGLQADLNLARSQLERSKRLLRDRAVSQDEFEEASAELLRAEAEVAEKQALIDKKTIRAPFSGQLGIRRVNLGQFLPAGSAIAALESLDPVYVDYRLPERHLSKLSVGQRVRIRTSAHPDRIFDGAIQAISPAVDRETRNVQIRAQFENPEQLLRPGMFARVETLLPVETGVLTLPREAVTFNTYGDSVFLILEGEGEQAGKRVVQRRQIQTGAVQGDQISVLEGLEAGDLVVSEGQVKLRNGAEVAIAAAGSKDTSATETNAADRVAAATKRADPDSEPANTATNTSAADR